MLISNIKCTRLLILSIIMLSQLTLNAQDCPTSYSNNSGKINFLWSSGTRPTSITSVKWTDANTYAGSDVSTDQWETTNSSINPTGTETGTIIFTYSGGTYHCAITAGALPIELMYFRGEIINNTILLEWATASEINNSHFTIERSLDNINWTIVTTIQGAGNSVNINKYKYADAEPLNGTVYYRLRQDDYNGEYTYMNTLAISITANERLSLTTIYPDSRYLNLAFDWYSKEAPMIITIYNQLGSVVKTINVPPNEVTNGEVNLDIAELVVGVYTVRVSSGTQQVTGKFIK